MKRIVPLVTTLVVVFTALNTARAQLGVFPIHVGIGGGGVVPLGDFGNSFNIGFNATGTIEVAPPLVPLGFRADAAYNQFGSKGTGNLKAKIASVTGNVEYGILAMMMIRPYLIGGAGYYRLSSNVGGGTSASNHFGYNVGAGINLPFLFKGFAEARYNHVSTNGGSTSFVPITVGLIF